MQMLGRGVASGLGRNAWLGRLLPSRTTLLRAPFLSHVILEDWLLEQPLPQRRPVDARAVESAATRTSRSGPGRV